MFYCWHVSFGQNVERVKDCTKSLYLLHGGWNRWWDTDGVRPETCHVCFKIYVSRVSDRFDIVSSISIENCGSSAQTDARDCLEYCEMERVFVEFNPLNSICFQYRCASICVFLCLSWGKLDRTIRCSLFIIIEFLFRNFPKCDDFWSISKFIVYK